MDIEERGNEPAAAVSSVSGQLPPLPGAEDFLGLQDDALTGMR